MTAASHLVLNGGFRRYYSGKDLYLFLRLPFYYMYEYAFC